MTYRDLSGIRMRGGLALGMGLLLVQAAVLEAAAMEASCLACHGSDAPVGGHATTSRPSTRPARQLGPEIILLDMLKGDPSRPDWFGPVSFNHRGHAGMAGSCSICHHHTPEGQQPGECRSCHEPQLLREDIHKPSLKGAYHRQCMGCHREWSHEDGCGSCHLPNRIASAGPPLLAAPRYMGHDHPAVARPDFELYSTEHEPGVKSIVMFRHNDHIERYGNNCVDCHRSDSCTRCHEAGRPVAHNSGVPVHKVRPEEEHHRSCSACHVVHDKARCGYCHQPERAPRVAAFDHAQTGWPLAAYHQDRGCRDCHRQAPFGALDARCGSCHPAPVPGESTAARLARGVSRDASHAAWYDYIRRESAAGLCLHCHAGHRSGAGAGMHPMTLPDSSVPKQLLQAGAQLSRDGSEVSCLVCHSAADARFEPLTLPDAGPDGLCLACHPQQRSIFGTVHDIRAEAGRSLGRASAGGTCRTCHSAHGRARPDAPTKGDPSGTCTACHQPRSWGQAKSAHSFSHADAACVDCHNPHESRFGRFLATPAADLCITCHTRQAALVGGPHDPSRHPEAWPDPRAASQGACMACHVPHSNQSKGLLRFPPAAGEPVPDGACLACHEKAGWGSKSHIEILHPREIKPGQAKVDPRKAPRDRAGNRRMSCQTCHDPHAGAEPLYLTRGSADEPSGLCLGCHEQKKLMKHTGHSAEKLEPLGAGVTLCQPCHAMHATRDSSWGQMLSPRFLAGKEVETATPNEGAVPCLACHHPKGAAPMPAVAVHPRIVLPNIIAPDAPGYLPLFDEAGHVSPNGQITCRTCHLSHGRLDLLRLAAEKEELSDQDRRMMRLNLRTFAEPNLCTQCHGEKGRLKFFIFHNAVKREELRPR